MTVINLYLFETLVFVKNNLNNIACDDVTHCSETRARGTFIRTLKHKADNYEKSVTYIGIQLYNSLPVEIKNLPLHKIKLISHKTNLDFRN
jgi:hypothetical protein